MRTALPLLLLTATPAFALDPAEVVVVANKAMPESRQVADHYLAKRKVPAENLVLLDLPTGEDVSRADYDAKLAGPLRESLKDRKDKVKVVLTVYGVPLRVGRQEPTSDETAELAKLSPELEAARKAVEALEKDKSADPQDVAAARSKRDRLDRRRRTLSHDESHAAVDSELMLLWWEKYPLDRWVPNPLYF